MKFLVGTILLASMSANAQVISNDELERINNNAEVEVPSEHIHNSGKRRNKTMAYIKDLVTLGNEKIPDTRYRTQHDKEVINYLKCVEKGIKKNKGGYDKYKVAANLLQFAVDNDHFDSYICENTLDRLESFPKRKMNESKLKDRLYSVLNDVDGPTKRILHRLATPKLQTCTIDKVRASAVLALGGGAGVQKTKCLYSDGRVKQWVGATFMLAVGFGGSIKVEKVVDMEDMVATGSVAALVGGETGNSSVLVLLTDKHLQDGQQQVSPWQCLNCGDPGEAEAVGLGLEMVGGAVHFGGGIRFFNGKRRWRLLLDQL